MATWRSGTTSDRTAREFEDQVTHSRVYDVEDEPFNAVADEYYVDGVATSGSATFTSATANFTADDVGKHIVILRAGPSGFQDHHTTISGFTNSTTVTLAHNAGRSKSSCRFYLSRGGDQTAAIQAAIDAANGYDQGEGGGTVLLPGVGYLVTQLVVKDRVTLKGMGRKATMVHQATGTSPQKPVIVNDHTTADNYAGGITIRDMWIDGNRLRNNTDVTTTLASGYTAGGSTLSLTDASNFSYAGSVLIGTNILLYSSKSGNTLNLVAAGGKEGTTDANASAGATVTQYNGHGIYFATNPFNVDATNTDSQDIPWQVIENVYIKNCRGDGISQWGYSENRIRNVMVHYTDQHGIRPSFDSWISDTTCEFAGRAGFYLWGAEAKITGCKAYYCGSRVAADGHGFVLEGLATLEEGTKLLAACGAQDNKGHGFLLINAQRCNLHVTASSNGTSSVNSFVGVALTGVSSLNIIDAICTERVASPNNAQQSALYIASTCSGNQIRVSHGAVSASAVGPAIKSTSDLTGGNDITVNNQRGKRSYSDSGSNTPDPYAAGHDIITLTGNITALNAPANAHLGCELALTFTQDGSGSHTLGGVNAIYKWAGGSAPTLTTTANRSDTFRFVYNGTSWLETSRATNVGA